MSDQLTLDRLTELLAYDPGTGLFTWKVRKGAAALKGTVAGGLNRSGYQEIRLDGKTYYAHRLVWFYVTGRWPEGMVDHINAVRHDNRFVNLRDATPLVNSQNRRSASSTSKSGLLGVQYRPGHKNNPWCAGITVRGKKLKLGYFPTPELAHAAYLSAKRVIHEGCSL